MAEITPEQIAQDKNWLLGSATRCFGNRQSIEYLIEVRRLRAELAKAHDDLAVAHMAGVEKGREEASAELAEKDKRIAELEKRDKDRMAECVRLRREIVQQGDAHVAEHYELVDARTRIAELEATTERRLELLYYFEWQGSGHCCLWCGWTRELGHSETCRVAAELKRAEEGR